MNGSRPVLPVAGATILGIVIGTFVSPLFSDRMAVEKRLTTAENAIAELRTNCASNDKMQTQFHQDMQALRKELAAFREQQQHKGPK